MIKKVDFCSYSFLMIFEFIVGFSLSYAEDYDSFHFEKLNVTHEGWSRV